jgi:transposase
MNEGQVLSLEVGKGGTGIESIVEDRHRDGIMIRFSEKIKERRMNICYRVDLTAEERQELQRLVSSGSNLARKVKRAQVLLGADGGAQDAEIAKTVRIGTATIYRTKRRFVEGGIARALNDDPRPGARRKLSGREEALLVATACADPPQGRAHWTCELLAGQLVQLTEHDSLSDETVRRRLAEKKIKPWQHKMWCIPLVDAEYVARMEDVLDLYAETAPPDDPVVCLDESPVQLIGETRIPIPVEPGKPTRVDYEYRRNGTANLFVLLDAHRPWRHVKTTDHRESADFAQCMRDLVDLHYPQASRIRVVLDNLSTHSEAALYRTFPADEARRVLRKIEFHYVPKHASWLNMVEIEIGVLKGQCLDRRIADRPTLEREISAWETSRNAAGARVRWLFTVERARLKMRRAYPVASQDTQTEALMAA